MNFCTLFDSFYLVKALALYHSLIKQEKNFNLYVYCLDNQTYEILLKMQLKNIVLVPRKQFETDELLKIKTERSKAEYCWTCTPVILENALKTFSLNEITYLDADLYFFQSPLILLEEFRKNDHSVLLTEHRYAKEYDLSAKTGKYCVQFMTFKSDPKGLLALSWWKERCIEWCYARYEDGKFGDQKYLDDWLTRFEKIHVLQNIGGGVAPWNVKQYLVSEGPKVNKISLVFYHFHNLKWFNNNTIDLCYADYELSETAIKYIYLPYIESLTNSLKLVRKFIPGFDAGIVKNEISFSRLKRNLKRRLKKTFYQIKITAS